jgi:hypothetical protein
VFIAQSAELSCGASDLTQFLVSISRGSKEPKIYTDDLELLRENVSQARERLMATELLYGQPEIAASVLLGQTGPEICEDQAVVLWKAPAFEQEIEITPRAPARKREQEREMEMEMGM